MSNQTVSTNLNIDSPSISGLNNNETITINSGATLTINSDNRWSQQAAIPQTITVDSGTGGSVVVDGTQVWEVPFSASSGTVPTLTSLDYNAVAGGSSLATGEFLSVFASGARVPSTAGAAMPATGFIKLRYKSGTFQAGETITLPNGATVTASNEGKRSWINFAMRNANPCITVRRLGNGITIQGDWYEVTTTQGISGETIQMPCEDVYGGLFIEKSPGSADTVKDYTTLDRWTLVPTAAFTAYNISNDNLNGKYFTCSATGLITFGNGIIGKIPTAGCKVYIGNVIMSSVVAGSYATNQVLNTTNTRSSISATMSRVFIDKATLCGWILGYSAYLRSEIRNTIGIDGLSGISNSSGDTILTHSIGGSYNIDRCPVYMANCINGNITIDDITSVKLVGTTYRDQSFYLDTCKNVSIKRMIAHPRRNWLLVQCTNVYMEDIVCSGINEIQGCTSVIFKNLITYGRPIGTVQTYATGGSSTSSTITYNISGGHDFQVGESLFAQGFVPTGYNINNGSTITATTSASVTISSTTNPGTMTEVGRLFAGYSYPVNIATGSIDVLIDGISYHPDKNSPHTQGLFSTASNSNKVKIRNAGSRTAPLDAQGISQYIFNLSATTEVRASKLFVKNTRGTYPYSCSVSDDIYISEVGQYENSTLANDAVASNNIQKRRIGAGGLKTIGTAIGQIYNQMAVIGTHFIELEVSDSETIFGLIGCEKTTTYPSKDAYAIISGNPQVNGSQGIVMASGDIIEYTSPLITGISGFNNLAPIFGGTNQSNHTFDYDIDKGFGFSGNYKVVSGSNLSAETDILPEGFRIKIRITCNTTSSTNIILVYGISMATSNALKDANPYPYNYPKLTLSGAVSGSDICVYDLLDDKNLICEEQDADYTYYPWHEDFNALIRCRKPGYKFIELQQLLTEYETTTPVEQTMWSTIPATDPGALNIGIYNHAPVSWNGLNWSITIQSSGSYTASQIANYINYNTAKDWPAIGGYRGDAWPEMVIENDSGQLETAKGILLGTTLTDKGVRVIDLSGNAIVGFAQMQSDDGTYYVPPQYVNGTVSGIISGSRLRVYNSTTNTEIANELVTSTTWSINYLNGTSFTTGDLIKIYLTRQDGLTSYIPYKATSVATDGGWSVLADQKLDTVYSTNGIDGSTVTEFVPDYPNIQIDINDGDGVTSVTRLYAFYCNIITSEDGIRYWFDAIEAVDTVNYKVNVDILDLKLDNTVASPILVIGGRLFRSDGTTVIASTSGSIQMDPDKVYVVETNVSGLTPEESQTLTNIKMMTKLIPAAIK